MTSMLKYLFIFTLVSGFNFSLDHSYAQGSFAPAAGINGTTAIHKDSSVFSAWATSCTVSRGYMDIADTSLGVTSTGTELDALGIADGAVISLGDHGIATLTFNKPIINGSGPDFAVFENSFNDDFLELAFVEVSEDGTNYYRFPAHSETQDTIQTDGFGTTDVTNIHNLAGKYRAQYGTPFDLTEIENEYGIQIQQITHVRIIDVIGSINEAYATFDITGNKINDPYPTAFPSGGFDLDAIGVIHQFVGINENTTQNLIYPNPCKDILNFNNNDIIEKVKIYNLSGACVLVKKQPLNFINISELPKGNYFLRVDYFDKDEFEFFNLVKI